MGGGGSLAWQGHETAFSFHFRMTTVTHGHYYCTRCTSLFSVIKIEPDCWLWLEEKNSWGNPSTATLRSKLAHICASFLWLSASMWRSWMGTDGKALGHLWAIHARITGPLYTFGFKNSQYVEERDSSLPKYKVTFWFLVLVHWVYIQDRTHLAAAYSDEALASITVFNKKIYICKVHCQIDKINNANVETQDVPAQLYTLTSSHCPENPHIKGPSRERWVRTRTD